MALSRQAWFSLLGYGISVTLHAVLGVVLLLLPAEAYRARDYRTIELTERRPPPPEPPPEPQPEPEPKAEPRPRPKPKKVAMRTRPKPKRDRPPPPSQTEPPDQPPPETPTRPPTFGIELEGTSKAPAGQGVEVPEGESLLTKPTRKPPKKKPEGKPGPARKGFKKSYSRGERAPIAVITKRPGIARRVLPDYPASVRELGIEGRVVLELTVDEQGRVTKIRVLRKLHPKLDEAARQAARKMRFTPALVNNTPVTVTIPYTFTFVLD